MEGLRPSNVVALVTSRAEVRRAGTSEAEPRQTKPSDQSQAKPDHGPMGPQGHGSMVHVPNGTWHMVVIWRARVTMVRTYDGAHVLEEPCLPNVAKNESGKHEIGLVSGRHGSVWAETCCGKRYRAQVPL